MKNKKILLAVSGGVDSMSLLHYYNVNNYKIAILHINHLTRGKQNELEARAIKKFANDNDIKLYYFEYQHKKENFQQQARLFRLNMACDVMKSNNYDLLIYGHHRDDLVENILMYPQKINYRGIKSYTKYQEITIYRPLLKYYKTKIYEYAKKNNVVYFEDHSNQETKYYRNQIRNQVLVTKSEAQKETIIKNEQLRYEVIKTLNVPLRLKVVELNQNYPKEHLYIFIKQTIQKNISNKLLDQISSNLKKSGNQMFRLPDDYILYNNYGELSISKDAKKQIVKQQALVVGENNFNGIVFENNLIGSIRVRKPGDKILINNCHKKVSRLMIELKIPLQKREIWPIVVNDADQVLYIPINK